MQTKILNQPFAKTLDADDGPSRIQLRSPDAIRRGGMDPELKLGAKLWISFKCSSNANISRHICNIIFALELHFNEIHSFAPRFNPGCVPPKTRRIRGP